MVNFIKKITGSKGNQSGCCGVEIKEASEVKSESNASPSESCCGSTVSDSCCSTNSTSCC